MTRDEAFELARKVEPGLDESDKKFGDFYSQEYIDRYRGKMPHVEKYRWGREACWVFSRCERILFVYRDGTVE